MMFDIRGLHMPTAFFENNRARLISRLPERCFVILFAGKSKSMTRDVQYRFVPNRNFFYLTGIDQEDSVLVIHKDKQKCCSILYIHSNDSLQERWTGRRLCPKDARQRSGVDEVRLLSSLPDMLHELVQEKAFVPALDAETKKTFSKDFSERLEAQGHAHIIDIGPALTEMRMCKQPCETAMIRHAINVCNEVLLSIAPIFQSDATELEIFAAIEYEMMKRGCLMPAFPTIVAGGKNAFCLHHPEPSSAVLKNGQLVQIDFGAIVGGLCSDISRVFPVGGIFSEQQLIVYDMVRKCQKKAVSFIRPDLTLAQINSEVREYAASLLIEVGVMNFKDDVRDYVWHNTVHHLGMDVHDVCDRDKPLEAGAVLAVEPGIYIPKWDIGFRIEDDVEIIKDGCIILSEQIVREAKAIELMVTGQED